MSSANSRILETTLTSAKTQEMRYQWCGATWRLHRFRSRNLGMENGSCSVLWHVEYYDKPTHFAKNAWVLNILNILMMISPISPTTILIPIGRAPWLNPIFNFESVSDFVSWVYLSFSNETFVSFLCLTYHFFSYLAAVIFMHSFYSLFTAGQWVPWHSLHTTINVFDKNLVCTLTNDCNITFIAISFPHSHVQHSCDDDVLPTMCIYSNHSRGGKNAGDVNRSATCARV